MQSFQLQVSLMRLFRRIKPAFTNAFALDHKLHAPLSLVGAHTQKPRLVSFCRLSHILQVAKTRYLSKIIELIVLFISILMVYMSRRPFARHIQPRKPMGQFFLVVNCNSPIARTSRAASTFADKIRTATMHFPDKFAGFWVIVKNRSNMGSGNHEFDFTIKVA